MRIYNTQKNPYYCADRKFVIINGRNILHSNRRGISTLLQLLREDLSMLPGSFVADRLIGKAAALLLTHGGVEELYAETISESAIHYLRKMGITYYYGRKVPCIVNHNHTGLCPLEELCSDIEISEEGYRILSNWNTLFEN